jgi:uncharacterized protein (TIGR00369 family)
MNYFKMTGLEIMEAILEGKIEEASMTKTLPMSMVSVESGVVRFTMRAGDGHLNPMGGVHGGFAATVLDSAMGCAMHTALEAGVTYGTVDLNIKMVRPIPKNKELIAEGRLINISKRVGISEGDIKDSSGKIYAHGTCTCVITRPQINEQ